MAAESQISKQKSENRRQQNHGKIYTQLVLQLSRVLYKSAYFYAKQSQL